MPNLSNTIGIVGGGAWGTALAQSLCSAQWQVALWAREKTVVESINARHENMEFLPGISLNAEIKAVSDFAALKASDILLLVTPAQHSREIAKQMGVAGLGQKTIVICSKGIEIKTGALLSDVVKETLPQAKIAVLSGPTFATEVAQGKPTAVTIAAEDSALAAQLAATLGSRTFRPYASSDMVGVQLGAAIKNVLAIACGIVIGRGLGESGRAAVVTRGLTEMRRLIVANSGKMETLMGLSCLGDLVLTCGSTQSRNMSLGMSLGRGKTLDEILKSRHSVAEGVSTAEAALTLAAKHRIEMPITEAVHGVLHKGANIGAAIEGLLSRPFKAEEI